MMSIAAQAADMRRLFPRLRLVFEAKWGACWRGPLVPFSQPYDVQIMYLHGVGFRDFDLELLPFDIRVMDPELRRRSTDPTESIPHTYRFPDRPPSLCVFDPAANDWTLDSPIAETIVPWTAEWLGFYELWHATGTWAGGGRHPAPRPVPTETRWPPPDPQAPCSASAINFLGRRAATSASYRLMAAASAGSSRPPSSWS